MRACRELGIATAAVYSDADRNAIHVRYADEAHHIGAAPAGESYLQMERIVKVAHDCGADAIHPGYGFLSEKAAFPEACEAAGIRFIGPPASGGGIASPRDIENKVIGDSHATAAHVGEGECSTQRRHQKTMEEPPSPAVTADIRAAMGAAAIRAAKAAGYVNAGTVEFIFNEGDFYFLEVNARLQVEHPITEAVTETDIVKEQIRIPAGLELSFSQQDVTWTGHAIEMRINAEDPLRKFLPNPKRIARWVMPAGPGVRVDSGFGPGSDVPPNYDSLIAKLIVHRGDRAEAIAPARRALREFVVIGPATTISYHRAILENTDFRSGNLIPRFIEDHPHLVEQAKMLSGDTSPFDYGPDPRHVAAAAAAVAALVLPK